MMEQPYTCKCHNHVVLVAALDNEVVAYGAAGLGNVFNTALVCSLDVVGEGEECVGTYGYVGVACEPGFLFFAGEDFGLNLEALLPFAFTQYIFILIADVYIDGVVSVGTTEGIKKLEV